MKPSLCSVPFMDGKYRRTTVNLARSPGILLVGMLVLGGCDTSINSSIVVPDGESRSGSLMSVNGDVSIGKDCTIEGSSRSVNGSIKVGDRSRVEDLTVINGSVRTGEGVSVNGNVESVNGMIELGTGSGVSGKVASVNGSIELNQTMVQQDIRTVNGDIKLRDKTIVKGDIVIEGKMDDSTRSSPIEIEVAGGSVIEGDIVVKRNVDIRLILSEGGKVLGQVGDVEVIDKSMAQPAVDGD